ncbi:transcription cofactor vestigial-like protein 4 [Limanda limanda]|uniref:transcription cofactor vestigial-like protein 4 n=1 Tax=Limanda limanda TaxID=27771 RepID=UPI0029C6CB9A|nr:transcription cofactor vestigial-like protein 4 [Limanda limanda]XP_060930327.1 transcription cofactor vestigial-like protein 4 [Limanda limanda]
MLFTRMDLLNSQFLDKMNNNIGRLHYDDESRTPPMPTAMSNITGPPPHCPSKRKYGEEQMDDRMNCDDDHMTKMSRLFATQLARPSAGDNRNEHWSHSPVEHITSSSNGLHGTHLYASISGYAVDQPLPLTKSSHDIGVGGRERSVMGGTVERQQNRPSVITCAPASNRNCNLSHCHMNGCSPSPPADQRKTNANTVCDPVIEEHFRRSLGKNYKEAEPESNSVSITGSVDDHFAKALGDAWLQIKAKGGGHQSPDSDP